MMKLKNILKIILAIISLWLISVTLLPTYSSEVEPLDDSGEEEYDFYANLVEDSDKVYEIVEEEQEDEVIESEIENEETIQNDEAPEDGTTESETENEETIQNDRESEAEIIETDADDEEAIKDEEDIVALVHIDVDEDGNITIDPDIEFGAMVEEHYLVIKLLIAFDAEDINVTIPEDWSYEISQNVEEVRGQIHPVITIRHTWLDTIQENNYVNIMPFVSGVPTGFTTHTVPANATAAQISAALGGSDGGNRVVSFQGNTSNLDTGFSIFGNRHVILATSGTNVTNHTPGSTSRATINRTVGNGRLFVVNNGVTLTLSNISLNGNATTGTAQRGGVRVIGGILNMRNASLITNSHADDNAVVGSEVANARGGGGVRLEGGTLNMFTGSTISNNRSSLGGGVRATGGSRIVMSGGTISDNWILGDGHAGGVQIEGTTTFIMDNGLISNNTAVNRGGGVRALGYAEFIMNNGVIRDNIADGSANNQGGGGVYLAGSAQFTLNNGTIENNRAYRGGGVSLTSNTAVFNMHGGTIRNNRNLPRNTNPIVEGGGVRLDANSTFRMTGGIIENNRAQHGGGVWGSTGSRIFMENHNNITGTGQIVRNLATINGGGIFTENWIQATGGIIENNTASGSGGGIFLGSMTANTRFANTRFIGNTAAHDGGAIFTVNHDYSNTMTPGSYGNLTIENVYFNRNTASENFTPPLGLMHVNMSTTNTSVYHHPLNNYDINFQRMPIPFSFTKMNELLYTNFDGAKPLSDAAFRLYIRDENPALDNWHYLNTITSDANGLVDFGPIIHGRDHRLIEEAAPDGFITPEGYWSISFDVDTGEMSVTGSDSEMPEFVLRNGEFYVGNISKYALFEFTKTMEDGITPLAGAVFNLYRRDEQTGCETVPFITGIISDENGLVEFEGLTIGHTYCLVETNAPNGFITPAGYWMITINTDGSIALPVRGDSGNGPDFILGDENDSNIYLPNERMPIPITGLEDNMTFYLSLTLAGATTLFLLRRYNHWKNKNN